MSETNRWLTDNWNLEIGDGVRDYLIMCFGHQVASCDRRDVADQIIANHHNKAEIERLKADLKVLDELHEDTVSTLGADYKFKIKRLKAERDALRERVTGLEAVLLKISHRESIEEIWTLSYSALQGGESKT